jgi:inosose dehydratase
MTFGIAGYRCLQEKLSLDDTLALVKAAGAETFEPLSPPDDATWDALGAGLEKHGLALKSVYVNSRLHEPGWEAEIEKVLQQAERAKSLGATIIVTNPQPIAWGQPWDKSDEQLSCQRDALSGLAEALSSRGMRLAYHVHDMELRHGARELHHMLLGIDQAVMGFCLDAHWLYRGCGDSMLAVSDLITQYARRVTCVHVRQSTGGVCAETLDGEDIDWASIARNLLAAGIDGPVYVELLKESGTPQTMDLMSAHAISLNRLREWFVPGGNR